MNQSLNFSKLLIQSNKYRAVLYTGTIIVTFGLINIRFFVILINSIIKNIN